MTPSPPSVSVIVPAYKTEPYIAECLRSIFAQTDAPPFEVIVVDDASPDGAARVASLFEDVILLRHDRNLGLSEARNTAIRHARGEYLFFVDSDDVISPSALRRLWAKVVEHPGVDIVYGVMTAQPGSRAHDKYYDIARVGAKPYDDVPSQVCRIHSRMPEVACNRLIKRTLVTNNNLFFTPGIIHEDVDWQLRAYDCVRSYATVAGEPTYIHFLRQDSITGQSDETAKMRTILEMFHRVIPGLRILDGPVLAKITDYMIHYRPMLSEKDRMLFDEILTEVRDRSESGAIRHLALFLTRHYPASLPRRPILDFIARFTKD